MSTAIKTRPRSRAGALAAVLLLLIGACYLVFPRFPGAKDDALAMLGIRRNYHQEHQEEMLTAIHQRDPPLGADFPMESAGLEVRRLGDASAGKHLIVNMGTCAACVDVSLRQISALASEHRANVVAFSFGKKADVEKYEKKYGHDVRIVHDPDGVLTRRLNAAWPGRIYIYDRLWKLRWLQEKPISSAKLLTMPAILDALGED